MRRLDSRARGHACRAIAVAASILAVFGEAGVAHAQIAKFPPPAGATTHTVIPGERYANDGLARWFLGGGYRDVWTTPIEVPVLDMDTTYGGLTPVETGGFGQTVTLEFIGADGLEYAVRSLDKDPTRRLAPELQGTVVAAIVQDQTAAFLPTAGVVVDPLLEAAGLLFPRHTLVVVPDDPRLGEFRDQYAGLVGMLVDRPQEGPGDTPGFAGSSKVDGTDNFLEDLEEGECHRADAREYLKARYIDMVIGDRDRHPGQWTWARFPEGEDCYVWRPVPEDRDQAFIYHDGALMTMYRLVRPQQVKFGPDYPSLLGLTFNGWELDRQILAELDERTWIQVAEELRQDLTDEVIERAVRRLPDKHYELVGEFLVQSMKERRDALLPEARAYFRMISRAAQIITTDRNELATFEHHENGSLTVTIRYLEGPRSDRPFFERTYWPNITDEVRVFLHGGDDVTRVIGAAGEIVVRAIGGGDDDRFVNESAASAGRTRFYDAREDNVFEGPAKVDTEDFDRPPSTNLVHRYALDWGSARRIVPRVGYSPDLGAQFGFSAALDQFGFRKVPWAARHQLSASITTTGPEFDIGWSSRFREALGRGDILLRAEYDGTKILRFHGFGNETVIADDEFLIGGEIVEIDADFYKVRQREIVVSPAVEWSWGRWGPRTDGEGGEEGDNRDFRPEIRVGGGPLLKHASASLDENEDGILAAIDPSPLGSGDFGQLGAGAWFEVDTRDRAGYPTRGFRFRSDAALWAPLWDVDETFGRAGASVSGFFTPGGARRAPTLALRVGGERVWGPFPFHEAAFVGGPATVRGFREQRFAGDGSLYGNAELRVPISQFMLLFPTDFGVHGVADVGRVFFEDDPDDADTWHTGFGGGVWLSILNRTRTLSATLVSGDDILGFYLQAGFMF